MSKKIIWTIHADGKFSAFKAIGFPISRKQVIDAILKPDKISSQRDGTEIRQRVFNNEYLVRVVVASAVQGFRVITFYPGRRDRYEN